MRAILFSLFLCSGSASFAYSEFIGMGYASCAVCHYNGAGGGALSDYGRALFAVEIAQRPFWNAKASDDELGAQSGFLGSRQLPWWIRPGVKYRGLWYQVNPGSQQAIDRFVQMQADANLAFFLDKKQDNMILLSAGYVPEPQGGSQSPEKDRNIVSHEYYWRSKLSSKSYLYLGFLDKVYGLRIPDHSSFSRKEVGVAQQDQAHSIIYHQQNAPYEFFLDVFAGNLEQDAEFRPMGASLLLERDMAEMKRLGFSLLWQKNDFVQQTRAEIHTRLGMSGGHSVLAELGYMNDKPENSEALERAYGYVQGLLRLSRGVHILSMGQYYKKQMDDSNSDQFKWGFGVDYFPMQRVEWRTECINSRAIMPYGVGSTNWAIQTQLHLSL